MTLTAVATSPTAGGTPVRPACRGRGADIHVVQRLVGHSKIGSTTRYLHLSDADLTDAKAFPAG